MPGGRVGGGGSASGGGGGRIGGGGGFGGGRVGGGGWGGSSRPSSGRPSYGRPSSSRPSSTRPSSGYRPTHYPTYVRPVYYNGGGGGGGNHNTSSGGGGGGAGCLTGSFATFLIIFLVIVFMLILFSSMDSGSSGDVTASTVSREPLAAGSVDLTGYYEDSTGLIRRSSVLQSGMKHFYDKTGVQPYLYVTQTIDGNPDPDDATLEAYTQKLYSELFTDSGHFLLVIYDPGSDGFLYYYIPGNASKTVLDGEALEIFEGYLYQESDEYLNGNVERYFSDVFELTADRIMSVTVNPMVYVAGIAVVLAILWLLYRWWRKAKEQKNKENEHMQHVLDADIEDLVDNPELKDLEEKYGSEASAKPKPQTQTQTQTRPKPDDGFTDMDLKDPALADLEEKYKD